MVKEYIILIPQILQFPFSNLAVLQGHKDLTNKVIFNINSRYRRQGLDFFHVLIFRLLTGMSGPGWAHTTCLEGAAAGTDIEAPAPARTPLHPAAPRPRMTVSIARRVRRVRSMSSRTVVKV